jgi:alkylhydroperoxidase family enzyme
MAFIATVPPGRATGETADVYRYMAQVGGSGLVANVVRVFSLRPGSMRRMIRSWELTMWAGDEPRPNRELVAAAVSRLNDCHY